MNNVHEFAFYITDLPCLTLGTQHIIKDQDLIHRIIHVLRLEQKDQLVLFSRTNAFACTLDSYSKKEAVVNVVALKEIHNSNQKITILLPLLKRAALEEALYNCTELGANVIQLVYTAKTTHTKIQEKDLERYKRIIIAAAEQSKHFCFPTLYPPVHLEQALINIVPNSLCLFGDPEGLSYASIINDQNYVQKNNFKYKNIILLIGPEGDLTPEEKTIIKNYHFIFIHLTQTILRTQQALTVLLGMIQSLR